jgi:chemotaxis methyl-accepting protein methylase
MTDFHYYPQHSPVKTRVNLIRIIEPEVIRDNEMQRRISLLRERFHVYAHSIPFGLWAPGLAITPEMRTITEIYLPIDEIVYAFDRFLSISLKFSPSKRVTPIHTAASWPDALNQLQRYVTRPDPSALLQRLMVDKSYRTGFLFALFLPDKHGGGFNRYPGQLRFLQRWLPERLKLDGTDVLRCLDSACATGESTYELAGILMENNPQPERFLIHGTTIDPLELFSAAHIYFPHDPERQASFRQRAEPVFKMGAADRIEFFTEDITLAVHEEREGYDLILCNGLLGGPVFHAEDHIADAITGLEKRLREGGIILAADRFHGGWKKLVPDSFIHELFRKRGFLVQEISDGLVAQRA